MTPCKGRKRLKTDWSTILQLASWIAVEVRGGANYHHFIYQTLYKFFLSVLQFFFKCVMCMYAYVVCMYVYAVCVAYAHKCL